MKESHLTENMIPSDCVSSPPYIYINLRVNALHGIIQERERFHFDLGFNSDTAFFSVFLQYCYRAHMSVTANTMAAENEIRATGFVGVKIRDGAAIHSDQKQADRLTSVGTMVMIKILIYCMHVQ